MPEIYNLWELVSTDTDAGITTHRLRVSGGWMVHADKSGETSSIFVNDPQHEWVPAETSSEET